MNFKFSIIIICKNEAGDIEQAIRSVLLVSDDIVVYDSGSVDGTIEIIKKFPVRLHTGSWEGFGKTRQKAAGFAKYTWVLVVDADEVVSEKLAEEIQQINLNDEHIAYSIQLQNYIGDRRIKWGSWRTNFRIRLYNKNIIRWNDTLIHEKLIIPKNILIKKFKNPIFHYTVKNYADLSAKLSQYALLTAEQYYKDGKRSNWLKRNLGASFAFVKSYFLNFGFLDGKSGYRLALALSHYTLLKYKYLYRLQSGVKN